ncbi:MAG TPA: hypothetical protein VJT71_14935 [Pyrinomonadaceae bacterium]|nr:hypothetical protein [Pyrinomonadaceae bacterium]
MSQPLSAATIEFPSGNAVPSNVIAFPAALEPQRPTWQQPQENYAAIATDPRYFQFAHIPDRIIRCLELCGVRCERTVVREILLAYYLFIGVVDDELELAQTELGEKILRRLESPILSFDAETGSSRALFMTEILKSHISSSNRPQILRKFRRLHQASIKERQGRTIHHYIKQRKLVGRLTAELSHLIIIDRLVGNSANAGKLMRDIGAVGCLVDSVIDAGADERAGLLAFQPTIFATLFLFTHTLFLGMKLPLRHPRLLSLFVEAARDNFRDRRRSLAISL